MKRFFNVLMCVCICGMLLVSAVARSAAAQGRELILIIDTVDTSRYQDERIIQAYVTVRHPQVGAVEDLNADDFTLRISDGKLFTPDSAEIETASVSMAIVLELYQTMQRDNGFQDAKDAVSNLCLNQKAIEDRVAVFSVRQGVDPDSETIDKAYEHDFTEDGGAVSNFVQDLQMENTPPGTPLYDTIIKAIRYTVRASREPVGRRGVIVITDGGDRESRNNSDVVIDAARNLRVPVYTIGYTGGSREYDQFLNELANRTGGDYRNTPDSEQFDEFLGELREELTKRYVLTFPVDEFETSRQILEVRADHDDLVGSDSFAFDVDVEPTPTPEPVEATATPAGETEEDEDEDEDGEQTFLEEWVEWAKDNVLYVAICGGALLLFILVAAILLLRTRKKSTPPGGELPYEPPAPGWDQPAGDWSGQPDGPPTFASGETAGPTQMGPMGLAEPTAIEGSGEWVQPGAPTPFYDKTEAVGGGYVAPQPPPPQPSVGAPLDGGTVILSRGPKMEHEALLIDRRANRNYDLTKPEMRLGRAAENDIRLDSEKVSRRHALIILEDDTFYIQDLGSANGTFVNGERVYDRTALHSGDEVKLGNLTFLFNQLS